MGYISHALRTIGEYAGRMKTGIAAGTLLFSIGTADVYAGPPTTMPATPASGPAAPAAPPTRTLDIRVGGKYQVRKAFFKGGYPAKVLPSGQTPSLTGNLILEVEQFNEDFSGGSRPVQDPPKPVDVQPWTGVHEPKAPTTQPATAVASPTNYGVLHIPIQSTTMCLNDLRGFTGRLVTANNVIQLTDYVPVRKDNGTPTDASDDYWVIHNDGDECGMEIDLTNPMGQITLGGPKGYVLKGYDPDNPKPQRDYRVVQTILDGGLHPFTGNRRGEMYARLITDDTGTPDKDVYLLDVQLPPGNFVGAERAARGLQGSAVNLNGPSKRSSVNDRTATTLDNITIVVSEQLLPEK